ncbi:sporulation integral membrane protein YtvI [Pelotomaculum propionicicum]|uniref:sporulation integral membrane protein YtvI n=1 Tax=Pelotomaculum propionicicum TaxID=258475 RepID=UPI003B7EE1D0
MRDFYKRHWNLIVNLGILIATLVIAAVAFKLVIPYFLPFLLGLILALAMEPVVKFFLRLKISRLAATSMAMLVTVGSLGVVMWFAISTLVWELARFISNLPHFTSFLKSQSFLLAQKLHSISEGFPPEIAVHLDKNTERISEILSENLSLLAGGTLHLIANLPNQLLIVVIMLIAAFFISKDLLKIKKWLADSIPEEFHCKLRFMADDLYRASIGFIKAQIILSVISAIIIMIGLTVIGAEYVVTVSLLSGLFSPVPVIGVGAVFIPLIVFNLITGNTYMTVGLLILFAVVIVAKHSLEPKVLGENIGIDPLAVLISLYAGYELLGFYGLILGPFVLITYNALLKAKAFAWLFQEEGNICDNNNGDIP